LPESVLSELDKKLTIVRKTPVAQRSLWFNVYNADYPPHSPGANQPRWEVLGHESEGSAAVGRTAVGEEASYWDTTNRMLRFHAPPVKNRLQSQTIELAHASLFDDYAYNLVNINRSFDDGFRYHRRAGALAASETPIVYAPRGYSFNYTDDLRVRFVLYPGSGTGAVEVRLSKLDKVFIGTIGMDGTVSIECEQDGQDGSAKRRVWPHPLLKHLDKPLQVGQALTVTFENLDYRVALSINGKEVLATTPDQYAPDVAALRHGVRRQYTPPQIVGENATFTLQHVVVERDIYYREPRAIELGSFKHAFELTGSWASPNNPIMLRKGEHFCMGDNSPQSQDSRLWTHVGPHLLHRTPPYQLGSVLSDQLVGKAIFVYWPSGHRLGNLRIVPNVGDMRWIR